MNLYKWIVFGGQCSSDKWCLLVTQCLFKIKNLQTTNLFCLWPFTKENILTCLTPQDLSKFCILISARMNIDSWSQRGHSCNCGEKKRWYNLQWCKFYNATWINIGWKSKINILNLYIIIFLKYIDYYILYHRVPTTTLLVLQKSNSLKMILCIVCTWRWWSLIITNVDYAFELPFNINNILQKIIR